MPKAVAIIGLGNTPCRPVSPEVSYREMIYEAAVRAYNDAGVDPRKDIESFVTVAEDLSEGTSIFDEYTPDQLGGALAPGHTIGGDGIHGLASAWMQILTGAMDIIALEAHSKASNMLTPSYLTAYALDPVLNRPLGFHPEAIAGMEMARFLKDTGNTREQCAQVSAKNRRNALDNPLAACATDISVENILASPDTFHPMKELDHSSPVDGAIVIVLASERKARALSKNPIWIWGMGWCNDSPSLETREWAEAAYCRLGGEMAYKMAGIREPSRQIHIAEVDDTYSYKELQHLEALRLCPPGQSGALLHMGDFDRDGALPVNVSGGNLGMGNLGHASGLQRVVEVALQLRGEAGKRQVKNAHVGIAQSWRGIPTTSGAVAILSNEKPRRQR